MIPRINLIFFPNRIQDWRSCKQPGKSEQQHDLHPRFCPVNQAGRPQRDQPRSTRHFIAALFRSVLQLLHHRISGQYC